MDKKWILMGLFWGLFMFIMMGIATPCSQGETLELKKLAISFIIWLVAGMAYGFTMHLVNKRKKSNSN